MASKADILNNIKKVVDSFGWSATLTNGFWIDVNGIKGPDSPEASFDSMPIFCKSVNLPSVGVDFEEINVGINKHTVHVPVRLSRGDLTINITGGSKAYVSNMSRIFSINPADIVRSYDISIYIFSANYENMSVIKCNKCYLSSIGEVSFEQSASNSFFSCPHTFKVGTIGTESLESTEKKKEKDPKPKMTYGEYKQIYGETLHIPVPRVL